MQEFYKIEQRVFNDLLHCIRCQTYEFWKARVQNFYSDEFLIPDHPLIKKFKYFTLHPGSLVFFIDEKGEIGREALVVRSKIYEDAMETQIDFSRAILLGIFSREGKTVVRYGIAENRILPYV